MSSPVSSLPEAWVERIWATMRATYGAAFDRMWHCPEGVDPQAHVAELKAVWGRELARFQQNPSALSYAIDNLPERAPNLAEFKALCNRRPEAPQRALPAPTANPIRVREILAGLRAQRSIAVRKDPKAWAHRLRERDERGDRRITIAQRDMYRDALRLKPAAIEGEA